MLPEPTSKPSTTPRGTTKTTKRRCTSIGICNVDCLSAVICTVGCTILVVNAALSFAPFITRALQSSDDLLYLEGVLSVLSNVLFLFGSVLSVVQGTDAGKSRRSGPSWNGTALNDLEKCSRLSADPTRSDSDGNDTVPEHAWDRTWSNSASICKDYIHEVGFVAALVFLCSSLMYFSTSIASFVMIIQYHYIFQWVRYPQLVAAIGLAFASFLLMLQAQKDWWRPAIYELRWHINLWNLIGSAGFIFCAGFGLIEDVYWARYQFGCSYLWGSWAFLLSSIMQWVKSRGSQPAKGEEARW